MKEPTLILVGAGPGDPELISLKGIRALERADVVLYDALVSEELLRHAPQAIHIYCGKRAGQHYMKQAEINERIVSLARQHGTVVRLKGGDPFVFGRGKEEVAYAEQHGLQTQIIPGISSATALATLQQIPLTSRGITESAWITTGTTTCGKLSDDIELAASSSATVVILMGIGKLAEIVGVFRKHKPGHYPVAIIQNGTLPDEKIVRSDLDHIVAAAEQHQVSSPAIILIGEVVNA